jgi:hypothetical protein
VVTVVATTSLRVEARLIGLGVAVAEAAITERATSVLSAVIATPPEVVVRTSTTSRVPAASIVMLSGAFAVTLPAVRRVSMTPLVVT